jgi:proliferating cell nuclear antigen
MADEEFEGGSAIEETVEGGEVFRIIFPRGKEFRYGLAALSTLLQEANLVMNPEGIRLKSIDPSKVSLVMLDIPSTGLEEYHVSSEVKIGISFDLVKKVLSRVRSRDRVELQVDTARNRLYIVMHSGGKDGGLYRRFGLPIINIAEEEVPEPRIDYPVRIRMSMESFVDVMASAQDISDSVILAATEDEFTVSSIGEGGKSIESVYPSGDESIYDYSVKSPQKAMYSVELIMDFVRNMRQICESLTLEFATNKPLKLTFEFPIGMIQFYLAPRVS